MSRRRYALHHAELDRKIEELVAEAAETLGADAPSDDVRQLVVSALRLQQEGVSRGDLRLLNNALKELRHALRVFAPYEHVRKVAVFGSARTAPEAPEWRQAHAFAERMVELDWMVITGAGEGIMGAAQGGAGRESSFGVNIRLPFEQSANEVIAGDQKLVNFRYFFTRKVTFVKEAHAIALFPGGYGTLDEGFEALTLIQTGKSELVPVVFVDAPGGTYWKEWRSWIDTHMRARGLVGEDDFSLFHITDDVDDAVREISGFYRNYHSCRRVGERTVLRLRHAPGPDELAALESGFGDLLSESGFEVSGPLPQEGDEAPQLPRLVFHYTGRGVGRLRQLVDHLNGLPAEEHGAAEASPHELVPLALPARAEREEDSD